MGLLVLWKIKVMWKLLVTNNIKSGYDCGCVSAPNVGHILFECPIVRHNKERTMAKCSERNANGNDQFG